MKTVQNIFNMKKPVGKIAERKLEKEKLTDQEEWTRLQKSLEKLRKLKHKEELREEKREEKREGETEIRRSEVTPERNAKKIFSYV